MKAEKFWATIKDGPDLARKHAEMVKLQGRMFSIPGDDKPQDWGKLYDRLGRPKDAASYELKRPELPEGVTYNENLEAAARVKFHELGLSSRQAQGLYDWFMGADQEAREQYGKRYETAQADLTKEWGAQSEANFALAQKGLFLMVGGNADHPFVKWLDSSGETFNPVLIKLFYDYAKGQSEDTIRGLEDRKGAMEDVDQVAEIEREIANARSDPKSAFSDPTHAGHKAEVERILGLYRKMRDLKGEKEE